MHYVMSDIHGRYNKYLTMLEKINFSKDDRLYIIGDIIDRGPDGGKLLLDVLTDSRVTLLMGNHEAMLISSEDDLNSFDLWLQNGARKTIDDLRSEGMFFSAFIPSLLECPVVIPNLNVNGHNFYLVHAKPVDRCLNKVSYLKDLAPEELFMAVWDRKYGSHYFPIPFSSSEYYPDTTFIIGHSPLINCPYTRYDDQNLPLISRVPIDGIEMYNIDCGCARDIRLGCLCLETMEEFYT